MDQTVIFADIVGSARSSISRIDELLQIVDVFPPEGSFKNSWGDAFVAVFDSAGRALAYSLSLRDRIRCYDWRSVGVSRPPMLRIALHSGPVEWTESILQERAAVEGEAFVEAARVEAIAGPGDVWVTATTRDLAGSTFFYFDDLGLKPLPKKHGTRQLFRAHWKSDEPAPGTLSVPPLLDDQHYLRSVVMRRFAFLWLLLDQLPRGCWGRSVPAWMSEVTKGISSFVANPVMSDEGGFETTVLNLGLLAEILGPEKAIAGIGAQTIEYLSARHVAGGYGTLALSRHGYDIDPHPRHTALAGWVIGHVLKDRAIKQPHLQDLFRIAVGCLFFGDETQIGSQFLGDRNPILLYLSAWHVQREIHSKDWADLFTEGQREKVTTVWNSLAARLVRQALRPAYRSGKPRHLLRKHKVIDPLLIPYGEFVRMEGYTLLTSAGLIDSEMHTEVIDRIRRGVEFMITDYMSRWGHAKQRYGTDSLIPRHRGPRPFVTGANEDIRDLGIAAMLFRSLRGRIAKVLWPNGLTKEHDKARYFLEEDLIQLFDRYLLDPGLFAHCNAGMFATLLVGDDERLLRDAIESNSALILEQPPSELTDDTMNDVLSELQLRRFVENLCKHEIPPPGVQIFTHSLARLLVDRCRPGRYITTSLTQVGITEISKRTRCAYEDPAFVEKYDETWSSEPDLIITAPFQQMIPQRSRILDVGCGPGHYAELFIKNGHTVDLLDFSASFLQLAVERIGRASTQKPLTFQCDLLNPVARSQVEVTEKYDAVWCSATLVHVPQELRADILVWFHSLLRRSGILFVNVQLRNPCVFSRDGRFFDYTPNEQRFRAQLLEARFDNEYIIKRAVGANTYRDSAHEYIWANFYARSLEEERRFDIAEVAGGFTSDAYGRCAKEFLAVHDGERSDQRRRWIGRELDCLKRLMGGGTPTVLDAGCGPGDFAIEMARRGWQADAVDIAPAMISLARERSRSVPGSLKFHVRDMRRLPGSWTNRFDGVLCVTALQHVPRSKELDLVLSQFHRVLKVGGVLRVDARLGRESGHDPDGRFIQRFESAKELCSILRRAGFEIIESEESELGPGKNCFHRPITLRYATIRGKKL